MLNPHCLLCLVLIIFVVESLLYFLCVLNEKLVASLLQESLEIVSMGAEHINQNRWIQPSKSSSLLFLPPNLTKSSRLWRNCGFSGGSAPGWPNPHLVPPQADNCHHFHHIGFTDHAAHFHQYGQRTYCSRTKSSPSGSQEYVVEMNAWCQ